MEEQPIVVCNDNNSNGAFDASHSVICENKDANANSATTTINENGQKTGSDCNDDVSCSKGSSGLGKFKDATSLYESYVKLEAEFTRKSQKISELNAELLSLQKSADNQIESENNNRVDINGTDYEAMINSEDATKFFNEHLEFNDRRDEINNIIKENIGLLKTEKPFELASLLLKGKEYKAPAELLCDDAFASQVSEDDRIKDLVINSYLKSLRFKSLPKVISGEASVLSSSQPTAPKTITEAGRMFEKMFK